MTDLDKGLNQPVSETEELQNAEKQRLKEQHARVRNWLKFGPYLAERQWSTVREDYSTTGDAWGYSHHSKAHRFTYGWGEDGMGGLCDDQQLLCFAPAIWNGKDSILKERLFGLTGPEGNHGEDVKELYYYLDNTPTHSYMRFLYKYPLKAFPYEEIYQKNAARGRKDPEVEIQETGIFDKDEYIDLEVEYAKWNPDNIAIRIRVTNRHNRKADIHLLPQLWFRNTWQWDNDKNKKQRAEEGGTGMGSDGTGMGSERNSVEYPVIRSVSDQLTHIYHPELGNWTFFSPVPGTPLFCDNETNPEVFGGSVKPGQYYKDGIHQYVISGNKAAVNPKKFGTKMALHYQVSIPGRAYKEYYFQLTRASEVCKNQEQFIALFNQRKTETDFFYAQLQKNLQGDDDRRIHRQALAGLLWTKQFYNYDVSKWMSGQQPGTGEHFHRHPRSRNHDWPHLYNEHIISMPDKWEYPWYAAWDLAFHCVPYAMVDAEFAKQQLLLLTRESYMHPNGQLPAYEWNFSDVNPPVHAWAAMRVYKLDYVYNGKEDYAFLEKIFHKLSLNFTWWVNRKDEQNNNIFQGGFLGLDNIGLFDRSAELGSGGQLQQSDATGWMAMYCLNMLQISLELGRRNPVYFDMSIKFFEHFLYIAEAMTHIGDRQNLWDPEDQFYYDAILMPDGKQIRLKVRSMVGLIPLFAVEVFEDGYLERFPAFAERVDWLVKHRPELGELISEWRKQGQDGKHLISLVWGDQLKNILKRMLNEEEFLSEFGIRAMSRVYEKNPYTMNLNGHHYEVAYTPAESELDMFGGNSNWRGPIWFPVNFLLIESLQRFHLYYGNDFTVEFPEGSGKQMNLGEVAEAIAQRLINIFRKNEKGERPVFGQWEKLQKDPHFRDYILFYEYFHGDNGRGAGASHQTGWTALVARLLERFSKKS